MVRSSVFAERQSLVPDGVTDSRVAGDRDRVHEPLASDLARRGRGDFESGQNIDMAKITAGRAASRPGFRSCLSDIAIAKR